MIFMILGKAFPKTEHTIAPPKDPKNKFKKDMLSSNNSNKINVSQNPPTNPTQKPSFLSFSVGDLCHHSNIFFFILKILNISQLVLLYIKFPQFLYVLSEILKEHC